MNAKEVKRRYEAIKEKHDTQYLSERKMGGLLLSFIFTTAGLRQTARTPTIRRPYSGSIPVEREIKLRSICRTGQSAGTALPAMQPHPQ
jgi:hypothetical protein